VRLLILRPAPGNAATACAARKLGFDPVCVPLFEVAGVDWTLTDTSVAAVAMTSANAARLGGAGLAALTRLPLYAVGPTTARAARDAGFGRVVTGPGDAAGLARLLADDQPGRIVHLAGAEHRALDIPDVETVVVYRARVRALSHPELAAVDAARLALVHSARAGARLAAVTTRRSATTLVAISAAAARACGPGWRRLQTAERPRDDAMLALARRLCDEGAVDS